MNKSLHLFCSRFKYICIYLFQFIARVSVTILRRCCSSTKMRGLKLFVKRNNNKKMRIFNSKPLREVCAAQSATMARSLMRQDIHAEQSVECGQTKQVKQNENSRHSQTHNNKIFIRLNAVRLFSSSAPEFLLWASEWSSLKCWSWATRKWDWTLVLKVKTQVLSHIVGCKLSVAVSCKYRCVCTRVPPLNYDVNNFRLHVRVPCMSMLMFFSCQTT